MKPERRRIPTTRRRAISFPPNPAEIPDLTWAIGRPDLLSLRHGAWATCAVRSGRGRHVPWVLRPAPIPGHGFSAAIPMMSRLGRDLHAQTVRCVRRSYKVCVGLTSTCRTLHDHGEPRRPSTSAAAANTSPPCPPGTASPRGDTRDSGPLRSQADPVPPGHRNRTRKAMEVTGRVLAVGFSVSQAQPRPL